ncbi:MAG TPA: glycosyltransferase family 4 protein [Candidatus Limnocylindria bacterium]|nr:glycosyltransferase family 4 protein [Candidatus Limnocylindria bacterium]
MRKPQVLFITGHLPYPPISGGRRRELELLTRLAPDHDLHVLAISKTFAEDSENASALSTLARVDVVPALPPPERIGGRRPWQVMRHRSPRAAALVAASSADVVHIEGFYLMQHLPARSTAPVLLVEQNVEYALWRQRARQSGTPAAWAEYRLTRRWEEAAWQAASRCAAVTEDDRRVMERTLGRGSVAVIPDGVDLPPASYVRSPPGLERDGRELVVFVGNFAYEPNVDAALHLARDIFPRVAASRPDARLLLVGNAPPEAVRALASDTVTVTGRVPDVRPFLSAATVVVCPLRIGGGVKLKMLEALCMRKAIVSTGVGLQGLGPGAAGAVARADDAVQFATAVERVLGDPAERQRLEAAAGALAARLPTWNEAAELLAAEYEELSGGRSADLPA